jgi:predicted DCC family thiol-disulfide oxidoreductase YuxK
VFCRSPVFAACSNRLFLFAFSRHFPPDIAGVATGVATFLAFALISCLRFSSGQTSLLFTLFYPFLQGVGRNAYSLANTNRWQLSGCNHLVHFCVSNADAC